VDATAAGGRRRFAVRPPKAPSVGFVGLCGAVCAAAAVAALIKGDLGIAAWMLVFTLCIFGVAWWLSGADHSD
jgi:hypothetical protein